MRTWACPDQTESIMARMFQGYIHSDHTTAYDHVHSEQCRRTWTSRLNCMLFRLHVHAYDSTIDVHSMKMIDSLCAHQDPRCPGHRSGRRRSEQPPWEAMEAHSPHHRSVFFPPWLTIMNVTRTASPAAPHSEFKKPELCISTFYEYFAILSAFIDVSLSHKV